MRLGRLNSMSTSEGWDQKWIDIFDHYQNDLRHAYYIHAMLEGDERHVLEIAAGSFRDMAELRRRGVDCEGMDFSEESVDRAKRQFPECAECIHLMSAYRMPLIDGAFDVTYHNGFWVLFEDEEIQLLATEQARVTKRRMIATVHNAHNANFVDYFRRKKEEDSLYDIRFFELEEVAEIMRQFCTDVIVIPVGKGKQHHEDQLIRDGVTDPAILRACLMNNGLAYLSSSERLMCIGTPR